MESSISRFYGALSSFLSHIQNSSIALADSLLRRPIPLDSATASFTQRLGQKVSSAASDLELLEGMAMDTVSVAEILGHMNEVYKCNQNHLDLLQDRLSSFGYVPESDLAGTDDDEKLTVDRICLSPESALQQSIHASGSAYEVKSSRRLLDEDHLFGDPESLQDIGLSDACLATLASEALIADEPDPVGLHRHQENLYSLGNGKKIDEKASHHSFTGSSCPKDVCVVRDLIEISRNDFDKLPAYVRSLTSWEDLQEATAKINAGISKKNESKSPNSFKEADLEEFSLGRKGKSYILALIRMHRLAVHTEGGFTIYRIVTS